MTTIVLNQRKTLTYGVQAACWVAMIFTLAVAGPAVRAGDAKGDPKSENKLIGTWKLVSAKYGGQEFQFEEGVTTVKHVTTSQFMWASYDKNGKVTRSAGGDSALKGELYEETPLYGIGNDFDVIKGKPQTFKWKVEGNKWYHNGKLSNGTTIEEVWERVERK
jgi:hypothetical protein